MDDLSLLEFVKDKTAASKNVLAKDIVEAVRMIELIDSGALTTFYKPFYDHQETRKALYPDAPLPDYQFCFHYEATFFINICVEGLDSFKHDELVALLEAYDKLEPVKQNTKDKSANYTREFVFLYKVNEHLSVSVTIQATVKADSNHCQRVQVGVETPEPKPIYKLVCDGQENPSA